MNKQQAIDAMNRYLELLLTDFPECLKMMTDEFVWENFLPSHVPFGGRYEGASGLQTYFEQLAANWEIGELAFHDFIFDPETRILTATGVEKNGKALPTRSYLQYGFHMGIQICGGWQAQIRARVQ